MSTLATYRALIPGHAGISDATVSAWLTMAARRHSSAAFGAVYEEAMVFFAASGLDPLVQSGQIGALTGNVCAPATNNTGKVAITQQDSIYWARYVDIRDTRSAAGPTALGPPSEGWPTVGWPWPT